MRTVVLDPPTAGLGELLERRRRSGLDRLDEVWEGVLHMIPAPSFEHAALGAQVKSLLRAPATAAGLVITDEFNLGDGEHDFRVPDGALHRPGAAGTWLHTAALVIEIASPGDESREKLPFYAAHNVDEVLIVEPPTRKVDWFALGEGEYRPIEQSRLIDLGPAALTQRIDWPATA